MNQEPPAVRVLLFVGVLMAMLIAAVVALEVGGHGGDVGALLAFVGPIILGAFAFVGIHSTTADTNTKVDRILNSEMEAKMRAVMGQELARFATVNQLNAATPTVAPGSIVGAGPVQTPVRGPQT